MFQMFRLARIVFYGVVLVSMYSKPGHHSAPVGILFLLAVTILRFMRVRKRGLRGII